MSRSYHSPYGGSGPAARWPWVLGVLAIVAVAAGVLLSRGGLPAPLRPGAGDDARSAAAPAAVTPLAEVAESPPAEVAQVVPVESPVIATFPAEAPGDQNGAATETPMVPPTPTAPPTPRPTAVPPETVAEMYVERWTEGDYDGLYDLLGEEAQAEISREEFVGRYEGVAERAGLTKVTASVDGAPNLQAEVPIRVEMTSAVVGEFTELNRLPLVEESDGWKVAWTPSLIFARLGGDGCVDVDDAPAGRGRILDRDGGVLAEDGPIMRVVVVPGEIEDERRVLRELSALTGLAEDEVKATYEGREPGQWWPVKDFPEAREPELLNALSDLAGVGVQPGTGRVYPMGAKAAHVVGYVSEVTAEQIEADPSLAPGQIIGQAGVEAGADDLLTGKPGGRLIVVQCQTRAERAVIHERPAVPAKDLVLTLDRKLQEAADAALTRQGNVRGSAAVLDPRTGAVLALVSHPSFDPNGFVLGFSDRERAALTSDALKPLLNRAAQAAYPTGSIFKAITFAAGMEELGYTGETPVECPSTFSLDGANQVWEDWTVAEGLPAQGTLTLHKALVNSCNTVFYQLGRDLDEADEGALPEMAKAFGLGAPTDIPYLPEVGGTVPDPKWKLDTFGDYWATGDAVNLAIGQGFLQATPLQMATAYAAIANGGDLLQPYVVDRVRAPGGAEERIGERMVRSQLPLSRGTIRELQSALRDQTSDPTGFGSVRVFGDFGWPIAGKTGTAQNGAPASEASKTGSDAQRGARGQKPHSWFAAFGPYGEEATIASTVMVEQVGEGVSYAAPVTKAIYETYLKTDLATEE
ncbi:MAG: Cell division protein FtsI [Peptidoglycan synthetase] [uncultured Thermomicrobiales bacterium]|uniref:Cell division protein FtsI [Peptidoglycan synthetase] n=1 Tax=uncultured Thermomicrobiales bacterium TaxID=1645740 RepID=A0A6J4UGH1_9BACT|nr:MAG: Cell division protein FtsI [Peptidoglycan synthetase] [uncultured Thermomicrobiales bacterium]